MAPKDKLHISLVVIVHVESGKSTLIRNFIFKCEGMDRRTIEESRKKLTIRERDLSNMPGFLTSLKLKEVLPLISLYGSSKPKNSSSPSLMPQDIEISSKI